MPGFDYFVVPEGSNWKIRVEDEDCTLCGSLAEAIEAALEAARGARKCGFSAEVFVHQAQGDCARVNW
jgi:hypothetical protein